MNFNLAQDHNWDLEQLDRLMPWERDIYVSLLIERMKEDEQRAKRDAGASGNTPIHAPSFEG